MILFLLLIGLFVGSFLGVLTDRIPRNETVVKGHSHCEFCQKNLRWYDLLPLLSFVLLRGRCRYCKHQLPLFYPTIEITTGIMFALTYLMITDYRLQITDFSSLIINPLSLITLFYYLLVISSFIVIFFTDLKSGIIPDKILFPAAIVTLGYLLFFNQQSLIINLLSGIGAFLFFVIISLVFSLLTKKQAMGGGDIKLAFLLGLFLGFPKIIVSLYLAFLTGALMGIILIIWKKKSFRNATLPFGPFLVLGAVISLFWGNLIYSQVLRLLGG